MRLTKRLATAPVAAALLLSACQGQQVNLLTDPKEILAAAATTRAARRARTSI